jgi:DNA-binding protein H-NS
VAEAGLGVGPLARGVAVNGLVGEPGRQLRRSRQVEPRKATRRKVAAKYKDGSGNSWSGRGSQPRWLKEALTRGEKLETFAI